MVASSPRAGTPSPATVTAEQIQARVTGACSLVATEFNVMPQAVMDLIDGPACCSFSVTNNIELVDVIRNACTRTATLLDGIRKLSASARVDYTTLTQAMDWWKLLDEAIAAKEEVPMHFEKKFHEFKKSQQGQQEQQKPKARTKPVSDSFGMQRFEDFKGKPDGKQLREDLLLKRQKSKKELLLSKMRNTGTSNNDGKITTYNDGKAFDDDDASLSEQMGFQMASTRKQSKKLLCFKCLHIK